MSIKVIVTAVALVMILSAPVAGELTTVSHTEENQQLNVGGLDEDSLNSDTDFSITVGTDAITVGDNGGFDDNVEVKVEDNVSGDSLDNILDGINFEGVDRESINVVGEGGNNIDIGSDDDMKSMFNKIPLIGSQDDGSKARFNFDAVSMVTDLGNQAVSGITKVILGEDSISENPSTDERNISEEVQDIVQNKYGNITDEFDIGVKDGNYEVEVTSGIEVTVDGQTGNIVEP